MSNSRGTRGSRIRGNQRSATASTTTARPTTPSADSTSAATVETVGESPAALRWGEPGPAVDGLRAVGVLVDVVERGLDFQLAGLAADVYPQFDLHNGDIHCTNA